MDCGCLDFCCKGCSCCLDKNKTLKEQEAKINELELERLELLARNMTIHQGNAIRLNNTALNQAEEIDKLKQENTRLRNQRNYWQAKRNELKEQLSNIDQNQAEIVELVENLTDTVAELKQELTELKTENQTLKNQVNGVSQIVQQTPDRTPR